MMGDEKPAELKRKIRSALGATDSKVAATCDKLIDEAEPGLAATLTRFRDALLRDSKRSVKAKTKSPRKRARAS